MSMGITKIADTDDVAYGGEDVGGKRVLPVSVPGLGDAFGRLRVSNLTTLFDSKQIHDNQPLFWDDQEVSGAGTGTTYNANQASTTLDVSATTAGKRVRQTFQRFNYQPGKSQLIILTGVIGSQPAGVTAALGMFDDQNGIFLKHSAGTASIVRRTYTSGAAVDTPVAQEDWNIDKLNGSGSSGITLDFDKTQIFFLDFEWLGVGRVRCGFFVDGKPIYCHQFLNTNVLDVVYMSTPNLPLRYEIENDGSGAASEIVCICSSVASEGGEDNLGTLRHQDAGTSLTSLATGVRYGALGIRLKPGYLGTKVTIENVSLLCSSANDLCHWEILYNPTTIGGTVTWVDQTNSAVQIAYGATANTASAFAYEVDGGYFATAVPATITVPNALRIGAGIGGTQTTIWIAVQPVTNNITARAAFTWREGS